jgi:hypothetical protein
MILKYINYIIISNIFTPFFFFFTYIYIHEMTIQLLKFLIYLFINSYFTSALKNLVEYKNSNNNDLKYFLFQKLHLFINMYILRRREASYNFFSF